MKLHFGYLLGLAALTIAACAAFFSVYGIGQLFAGATTSVIIMASSLEFGKLVAASYLQRYWSKINILMRIYVIIGVTVLITITSGGIYGFLSSAYQETYQKLTINENEISFLKQKESFYADDVSRYDNELKRISENINSLSTTRANSIQVRDTSSSTGFRNTISTSGLKLAQKRIEVEEKNREQMLIKRNVASDSLQKYQLLILNKENNSEVSGELGPLKYISKLTNTDMDIVVNYFILLLIFVFDPLAITLVIATNWVFEQEALKNNKKRMELEPITKEVKQEPIEKPELVKESEPKEIKQEPIEKPELAKESEPKEIKPEPKEIKPEPIEEVAKEIKPIEKPELVEESEPIKGEKPKEVVENPTNKNEGFTSDDLKKIRKNQQRNFSRSIPVRRGY